MQLCEPLARLQLEFGPAGAQLLLKLTGPAHYLAITSPDTAILEQTIPGTLRLIDAKLLPVPRGEATITPGDSKNALAIHQTIKPGQRDSTIAAVR